MRQTNATVSSRSAAHQGARYVLAIGTVAGLGLAVIEADTFWIAQVLLAGLVVAEIAEGLTRLVLYRRGL
jgi:hypothetical protein